MLTKNDLDQIGKLVRKIVREEVETEVSDARKTLETQIRLSKMQIQDNINDVDDRLKNVEIAVEGLTKDMKDVKKRVRKTEKTVDYIIGKFNEEIVSTQKRVTKIEDHLGLAN